MKIRIKGNSIRMRLSKSEVDRLAIEGHVEEQTQFANNTLIYSLQSNKGSGPMLADFTDNQITVFAPESFIASWPRNEIVGLKAEMPVGSRQNLTILIEKDFICLDATNEDQADNFDNPNKTC